VLIPLESDGRVVIIRQYRAPIDRVTWEFPAGRVDPGETTEDAAKRECEEEIGRVPHRIERIGALFPAPGFCDEELIFFRVEDLRAPSPHSTPPRASVRRAATARATTRSSRSTRSATSAPVPTGDGSRRRG
jgi:8-oxo-dGTP pyrophosphatase MutT (NUDIX family)